MTENDIKSRWIERRHIEESISAISPAASPELGNDSLYLLRGGHFYPASQVYQDALSKVFESHNASTYKNQDSLVASTLRRCGFTVVPKNPVSVLNLVDTLNEILALQKQYSSVNTAAMARRGLLIRDELPSKLRRHLQKIEPHFTDGRLSCAVAGSDGKGRKNESPWVRIYDPFMSPVARIGWYIVLHFSRQGDLFYAGVGCGGTRFKDGSFVAISDETIATRMRWAKKAAAEMNFDVKRFASNVQLHGNSLSRQFEKTVAFAAAYDPKNFASAGLIDDLETLSQLLIRLYELERLGREPVAIANIDVVLDPTTRLRGQARGLTASERKAVEMRAMEVAMLGLKSAGFTKIKDVSNTRSYDFSATKDNKEWCIEVKGTTSDTSAVFLLTQAELRLHRQLSGQTVLALVSRINLMQGPKGPSGCDGVLELFQPWDVNDWEFSPTAYRAERRMG